jgi:mannose-6-phosphate isomerase-like protein (cupin superfamily)
MTDAVIGGIGLTILEVYDQRPGPDGVQAGCAHIHAITDEAYFGLSGRGAIELHDPVQGFRRVAIEPGTFVQFPAGTLHRSVSDEKLRVLAIMGNSGLPERGDARIYFGADVDADPGRYEAACALVAKGLEGGLERRDLSARAYAGLMRLWETDRPAYARELERFLAVHRATLAPRADAMADVIERGPMQQARTALHRLAAATSISPAELWTLPDAKVSFGMCGVLRPIDSLRPG